jgi:hypothetical protein
MKNIIIIISVLHFAAIRTLDTTPYPLLEKETVRVLQREQSCGPLFIGNQPLPFSNPYVQVTCFACTAVFNDKDTCDVHAKTPGHTIMFLCLACNEWTNNPNIFNGHQQEAHNMKN